MHKKMKNIKHNLVILPGDVVLFDFDYLYHDNKDRYKEGTIIEIEERLECCNMGENRMNDVLKVLVKNDQEIKFYDRSYVTKVLFRPEKVNQVFSKTTKSADYKIFMISKGKFNIKNMISIAKQISKFYISKEIQIDEDKILKLYERNHFPGYQMNGKIRIKVFKKWVLQNIHHIKRTRFEIFKFQTYLNTLEEEDYWNSVRQEYEQMEA